MRVTVLVVDDHTVFRRSVRSLLEADGFDVVGKAATGAAAGRLRPRLVLLDFRLPDGSGFEVAGTLAGLDDPPTGGARLQP